MIFYFLQEQEGGLIFISCIISASAAEDLDLIGLGRRGGLGMIRTNFTSAFSTPNTICATFIAGTSSIPFSRAMKYAAPKEEIRRI